MSDAQYTQEGQAISYNNLTCQQLIELFSTCLGPDGTLKALVSGNEEINLTKDGISLCKEVKFTHPTSIVITRSANSLYETTGDGIITYILIVCHTFTASYEKFCDGSKIPQIVNSLQLAVNDVSNFLKEKLIPLDDKNLRKLVESSLRTKIKNGYFLAEILIKALSHTADLKLIEIMKMEGGDLSDSQFIPGLVLDHAGRSESMPEDLSNVCILITNMSMEYEKPEVSAEFAYNSIQQREKLAEAEKEFIGERARKIAQLAAELRKENKSLLVISEKGIDLFSLDVLSKAGVLALRRAKRRNLERLIKMCGGTIVTQLSQVNKDSLGFCKKVTVKKVGENKWTFIEGVPLKGASTILVRGNVDYSRASKSIKGTLMAVQAAAKSKCCIRGGKHLYKQLIEMLRAKKVHEADSVGYEIIARVFENILKTFFRNANENVQEKMVQLFRDGETEEVIDNAVVVGNCVTNAIYTTINLLMCDEMILAGKPMSKQ
ncbi:cct6 [Nucleospora cyclopteri]